MCLFPTVLLTMDPHPPFYIHLPDSPFSTVQLSLFFESTHWNMAASLGARWPVCIAASPRLLLAHPQMRDTDWPSLGHMALKV